MRSSIEISPTVTLKALSYVSSFHAAREKSLKRIQKAVRWKDVFPLERVEMSFDSFFFFLSPFFSSRHLVRAKKEENRFHRCYAWETSVPSKRARADE